MTPTSEAGRALVEAQLQHFGVKGMHWGVRRRSTVPVEVKATTGRVRSKTKVSSAGGESHPAHADAVAAAAQQQKLKKSGTNALSNKELRDLITRRQLEDQVKTATSSKTKKFVSRQLEVRGQQEVQKGLGAASAKAFAGKH